ncbi:MAG TPA: glutamate racemase [Gammaproteobacteria bacterium]
MTDLRAPIGIFDSGIGGLTVLDKIHSVLPYENIIYIADSLHAPYGDNPPEFILSRSLRCAEFLADNKVKCLVIASNTATACASLELRNRYPSLLIVATEPPVKPAIEAADSKVIGVLVTAATSSSGKYDRLLKRVSAAKKIITQPCPGLVKLIETQGPESDRTVELLTRYLMPLIDENIDTLVLGCTHYPYLSEQIRRIVGADVTLIDPSLGVARHVRRRLEETKMLSDSHTKGAMQFWTSGSSDVFASAVARSQHAFGCSLSAYAACMPIILKESPEFNLVNPVLVGEPTQEDAPTQPEGLLL